MCDILWYLSLNFLAEKNSSQTWNLRSFRTIPLILPPIKGQARLAITSPLPCLMVESPGILEIHKKMAPKTHQKKIFRRKSLGNPVATFSLQGIYDYVLTDYAPILRLDRHGGGCHGSSAVVAAVRVAKGVSKSRKKQGLISEILTFFREISQKSIVYSSWKSFFNIHKDFNL